MHRLREITVRIEQGNPVVSLAGCLPGVHGPMETSPTVIVAISVFSECRKNNIFADSFRRKMSGFRPRHRARRLPAEYAEVTQPYFAIARTLPMSFFDETLRKSREPSSKGVLCEIFLPTRGNSWKIRNSPPSHCLTLSAALRRGPSDSVAWIIKMILEAATFFLFGKTFPGKRFRLRVSPIRKICLRCPGGVAGGDSCAERSHRSSGWRTEHVTRQDFFHIWRFLFTLGLSSSINVSFNIHLRPLFQPLHELVINLREQTASFSAPPAEWDCTGSEYQSSATGLRQHPLNLKCTPNRTPSRHSKCMHSIQCIKMQNLLGRGSGEWGEGGPSLRCRTRLQCPPTKPNVQNDATCNWKKKDRFTFSNFI